MISPSKFIRTLAYAFADTGPRGALGRLLLTTTSFRAFRSLGVHVTPVHFYSPIPDIRELPARTQPADLPTSLPGIDLQPEAQRRFMEDVLATYQMESRFPVTAPEDSVEYFTDNVYFGYVSASAMYGMIRHHRPARIVEVGAGMSTLVIAAAARVNAHDGDQPEVMTIDPGPTVASLDEVSGISRVLRSRVQDVDAGLFGRLARNDILSIDTSHTVKTGGEVPYLYLEVLPCLPPGVLVHIHDIFLPDDYPRDLVERRFFWNEQYLVQAFLVGNHLYDVVWAQRFMELRYPDEYREAFSGRTSDAENNRSYSLWLRRTDAQ